MTRFDLHTTSDTSASPSVNLGPKRDNESGWDWLVREVVGSLLWLSTITRPDITNAVRAVARYAHATTNNALVRLRTAFFLRTGAHFVFIFYSLGEFGPPTAQTKAIDVTITDMPCSVVAEMSTKMSKMHLGSILVSSAVCRNCIKIVENALTVPQNDGSSRRLDEIYSLDRAFR